MMMMRLHRTTPVMNMCRWSPQQTHNRGVSTRMMPLLQLQLQQPLANQKQGRHSYTTTTTTIITSCNNNSSSIIINPTPTNLLPTIRTTTRHLATTTTIAATTTMTMTKTTPKSYFSTTTTTTAATTDAKPVEIQKTALYDLHVAHGGDMVSFANYSLPILYKGNTTSTTTSTTTPTRPLGIVQEHIWCRTPNQACIFDVSHMGQLQIYGKDRIAFLESLVVADVHALPLNQSCLSVLTNSHGGIIDDTVITNANTEFIYMVINGATKMTDLEHLQQHKNERFHNADVHIVSLDNTHQLIAVQGSGAAAVIQPLLQQSSSSLDLSKMKFMSSVPTTLNGIDGCRITRYAHFLSL
jgi:Aminomethyltransferase folate-binding domain